MLDMHKTHTLYKVHAGCYSKKLDAATEEEPRASPHVTHEEFFKIMHRSNFVNVTFVILHKSHKVSEKFQDYLIYSAQSHLSDVAVESG